MLAKHAQHVVLVHFPIALTTAAIVFEWIAVWRPGPRAAALAEAAYWNLSFAATTVVATLATGLLAWQWQLEGAPLRGTLLLHALFGGASGVMIVKPCNVKQSKQCSPRRHFRMSGIPSHFLIWRGLCTRGAIKGSRFEVSAAWGRRRDETCSRH
jgi:uncharacterized membrane protein